METICKHKSDVETSEATKAESQDEKIISCAYCLSPVTDPSRQIQVSGSFNHVFANPAGFVFEIGCFKDAPGCSAVWPPSDEFPWFAGFSWQVGICKFCTNHLGWVFISQTQKFYGLILEKLIFP